MIVEFSELKNKTLKNVEVLDDQEIIFTTSDGKKYKLYHEQNCCENVYLEDIDGNIEDLIGQTVLDAYESTSRDKSPANTYAESYTWTFYSIRTVKTSITIRWYGESNGYYSEEVDFVLIDNSSQKPKNRYQTYDTGDIVSYFRFVIADDTGERIACFRDKNLAEKVCELKNKGEL